MIAASEPVEFVPHGRAELELHPGNIYTNANNCSWSENSLLYKLTNFAIKDNSILGAKLQKEKEKWSVREVCYENHSENEDPPAHSKEVKDEYMSESFRPVSRLKYEFNISIKSELRNGGIFSRVESANNSSNMSKKFNLTNLNGKKSSRANSLLSTTAYSYEEELYVKGCTAIWSKGLISTPISRMAGPETRETIACYTVEHPIKHAVFCDFHININNTMLIDALNSQISDRRQYIKIEDTTEHLSTKIMPSVLLLHSKSITVYAKDGREYVTNVPFQVRKVWPMKYGVLLEKEANCMDDSLSSASCLKFEETYQSHFSPSVHNMSERSQGDFKSMFGSDVPLPTCFSLSHPLDEVIPVLMKSPTHGCQYFNDGDLQILFVSTKPSIILLYDWKLGTHSLWYIRKAQRDECLSVCPNTMLNSNTTVFSQSFNFPGPMTSPSACKSTSMKNTSLADSGSMLYSKKPVTKQSKTNSISNVFNQQGMAPHRSLGQASSTSMMANTVQQSPPSLPLYPEICLDHIWTDSQSIRRDKPEPGKSFLHTDLIGHDYLCFHAHLFAISKLYIIRLQKSHSHSNPSKSNIIVGSMTSVTAKDAVGLPCLKMIALIDETGNIVLYTGTHIVGKVHVGGVLARLIDSPYTKPNFQSPFPRRSSLLPTRTNDPATFDDPAMHLLSPVPHSSTSRIDHQDSWGLQGLCDAAGNRITLCFDRGAMYRITLPDVCCSPLVARCCEALKSILPKDVSMQTLIKWYGVRNAPGTQDLTPDQEWTMFSNLLYTLLGYNLERMSSPVPADDLEDTSEVVTKKQRTSNDGTHDDWEYLLNTKMHKSFESTLPLLNLSPSKSESKSKNTTPKKSKIVTDEKTSPFNTNSVLFPYFMQILYAFHLTYEDVKLNTLLLHELQKLSTFLYRLAKDLRMDKYLTHYWIDFPTDHAFEFNESDCQLTETQLKKLQQPVYFSLRPPHFFEYLNGMLSAVDVGYYPYLPEVNNTCRDVIEVLLTMGVGESAGLQVVSGRDGVAASSTPRARFAPNSDGLAPHQRALAMLSDRGVTLTSISHMPPAVSVLLMSVLNLCRASPVIGWSPKCYELAMRPELALQTNASSDLNEINPPVSFEVLEKETAYTLRNSNDTDLSFSKPEDKEPEIKTGMEHLDTRIMRLLYPRDHRLVEVFGLLQSSIPVTVGLLQRPEVSDHEFIEEQEKYLYAFGTRTMALPVARGMLTLRSLPCVPSEPLSLPKLNVSGRGLPPRCVTIELGGSGGGDSKLPCLTWPSFHNGVAAGLALVPALPQPLYASWMMADKPKGSSDMSNEHAGFLMALGLNGHLKEMPFMNIYDYLVRSQEMISIGLLLGLAANYRGTMDVQATKVMSIHLEPLLPTTSIELDIQQNILVAALMGIGLIYQGTNQTHYAQVLLGEIGKPPGPEMENCVEREGYALAAGLALGMVCVGAGDQAPPYVAHALRTYMLGGDKQPCTGNTVNLDVTSPGATLALGLIYLGTGNMQIASWLQPPHTSYLLDFVRPDLLMLRCIARGLILWHQVLPDEAWVEAQVPATIRPHCFVKPVDDNIDYEAMNQAYCNIVAGACFTIGLRYAGTGCEDARDTLLHYTNLFIALAGRSLGELAGWSTLESCLCVCLVAAGMVMTGRGDLCVMRICRRLRGRLPLTPSSSKKPSLTHGGQMAVHCALGLLFLGGGRNSLSSSPASVAALIAAFFPKFPIHSEDNRYHLQAFRHLYVLAVEPRLILFRDLNTGKLCYAHLQVIDMKGVVQNMRAPCILPELERLREVRVNDPRYWPVVFQRDRNWDQLKKLLDNTWCVDVKQRSSFLSYVEDNEGIMSILGQILTLDKSNVWYVAPENVDFFTSDVKLKIFINNYLENSGVSEEPELCSDCCNPKRRKGKKLKQLFDPKKVLCKCRDICCDDTEFLKRLNMATYDCVVNDLLCALPLWTSFLKIVKCMRYNPSAYQVWQVKLLVSQMSSLPRRLRGLVSPDKPQVDTFVSNEFSIAMGQKLADLFDAEESEVKPFLRKYLGLPSCRKINNCSQYTKTMLSAFVAYHEIHRGALRGVCYDDSLHLLTKLEELNLNVNTISIIEKIL